MRFLVAVTAVGVLIGGAATASPVLYGEAHFSINKFDQLNDGELRMDSHHSAIGIKGSEDLDHGVKLIYKAEFGYDSTEYNGGADGDPSTEERPSFSDRDQWLGLAARDWGVIRFGTISTGYKSSGARLDPLYRSVFEQRGYLGLQSSLHDGEGENGGRSTNTVRIDSMKVNGAKLVASYALAESRENTSAIGLHYERVGIKANFDYLKSESASAAAYKLGVGYSVSDKLNLSFQYESADEVLFDGAITGIADLGSIESVYKVDMNYMTGNSAWIVAYGAQRGYSSAYLLAWDYKLSARSDVYAGYAYKGFDRAGVESDTVFAFGLKHKF